LVFKRLYSNPVDKLSGIRSDQIIKIASKESAKNYSDKLCRIHFYDSKGDRHLIFLTNNFILPAIIIADLYRCCWQAELFFKWIKQNLKIKSFFGTSQNAVYSQIWIAISTYLLVAILKKKLQINKNLSTFLQFLSLSLFEKTPILHALQYLDELESDPKFDKQLNLFDI
jgi:hypothetical protein